MPGGRIVKVQVENGRAMLPLEGPPNAFRKDEQPATFPLIVDIDPERRWRESRQAITWPSW